MNNSIVAFAFENFEIRFVDGKPVANDVAAALGYANPAKTVSTKVSEQNKGLTELVTPGGSQMVSVLEEAGIYQLIFSSKLESAEKFQEWVFSEVLPSIRKTGGYSIAPQPVTPQRQLAPQRDLKDYWEMAKEMGISTDPILLSLFSQRMAEQLGGKCLPQTETAIATVRAHQLGYSQSQIGTGSALGTFVKKLVTPIGSTKHGRYDVNVYDLTPELDTAIHAYFS